VVFDEPLKISFFIQNGAGRDCLCGSHYCTALALERAVEVRSFSQKTLHRCSFLVFIADFSAEVLFPAFVCCLLRSVGFLIKFLVHRACGHNVFPP
jgi:hypothetical protein